MILYYSAKIVEKYCSKLYDKEQINLEILNEKLYERLLILLFGGKACCHLEDEVKWQWVYKYYEEVKEKYMKKLRYKLVKEK